MQAAVLHARAPVETNPLVIEDVPTPEPGDGEILVRVRACGVCRTDLHVTEGELPVLKSPLIPGHQVVGIVERNGPGATKASLGCIRPTVLASIAVRVQKTCAKPPPSPATP
jgi:propanol-preferring alcohol dehydrogenase